MKTVTTYEENFERGVAFFNEGDFHKAHESWEPLWLDAEDPMDKQFLHGLIMTAGAFLHYKKRECAGAAALLAKCKASLEYDDNAVTCRFCNMKFSLYRLEKEKYRIPLPVLENAADKF